MSDYYDLPVIHLLRKTPFGYARSPYAVEANPWARRGEVEAALLFRGIIVSSYGFIETNLADLSTRASRMDCYSEVSETFPHTTSKRLKFLRNIFAFGPLEPYQIPAVLFFSRFEGAADLRHFAAHSKMQVLPDWGITLEDIDLKKGGQILRRTKRFTIEEFELLAFKAARLSRLAQKLSDKLNALGIIPPANN